MLEIPTDNGRRKMVDSVYAYHACNDDRPK